MVNKVILIGHIGRDPELKYTQAGMPICTLSIATDESYVDRDGNKVDRTEWHTAITFQKTAENCANFLAKGSLVYVEGSLQTRKWQDQQGQDRYSTEVKVQRVQFLSRKGQGQSQAQGNVRGSTRQEDRQRPNEFPSEASGMDGVPF
ncbi:single-stranded DNA-binding protein [Desulfovibrio sp. OttesenSCG-928-G15]|nr:single-stranded DNA-binding protein [Desulfovibrio sp. OttesenSCG-928-G15]